jgi:hypothetical protein
LFLFTGEKSAADEHESIPEDFDPSRLETGRGGLLPNPAAVG